MHPRPILLLCLALAAPAAHAQSSLGQQGSLPPPRAAAPAPAPAPAQAPTAQAPQPPAPARPAPAKPPQAPSAPRTAAPARPAQTAPGQAAPTQAAPAQAAPARPPAAQATPTVQPRPGTTATRPATPPGQAQQQQRRRAAPAAAAAGAAAGAAAVAIAPPAPAAPPPPPAPTVGADTGRPLPRFAALGSNQVNLRIGPDLRFRIDWTYQRKDLPVQIIEEHQVWRRIRDPEGTEGWVQRPLLTSRRTFIVQGEERTLRRRPDEQAEAVAHLRPGVIGSLRRCEAGSAWCEARIGDYSGWIRRRDIWGVMPDEVIGD
ncbi:SH3 domain-containing protein [Belnapia sp. F-4-1]|uniref:SH3 domain-containing protein n=1 Tax=Belnapia sp. F-4-1 TaxID=1545443 RepID=UPI0009DD3F0A|nr:SH3 domain-containing protein [Belnapia sp. F-4-1]